MLCVYLTMVVFIVVVLGGILRLNGLGLADSSATSGRRSSW